VNGQPEPFGQQRLEHGIQRRPRPWQASNASSHDWNWPSRLGDDIADTYLFLEAGHMQRLWLCHFAIP
jgi:hypothetical protein